MYVERRLYLRLFSFCIGTTMDILSYFIDTCILKNTDFDQFLNKYKHQMFHRWKPTIPCCECIKSVSIAAPNKKAHLNISQMKTVYKLDGQEVQGHVITNNKNQISQDCLCKISAIPGITTETLDIGLVHCLIKTCSGVTFSSIQNDLEVIRKIRNDLAHHENRGIMTEAEFNQKWHELENAVLAIARKVSISYERKERKQISSLKNMDVNLEDVTDRIECMEDNFKEQFKIIIDEQNRINGSWQTFMEHFKPQLQDALEKQKDEFLVIIKELIFKCNLCGIETETESVETGITVNPKVELDQKNCMQTPDEKQHTNSRGETQWSDSKTCLVHWNIATPGTWDVGEIKEKLEHFSHILSPNFRIEFLYKGSLVIYTSVRRNVLKDREVLKFAIKSFLERIVKNCGINTDVPETVHVDFTVLDFTSEMIKPKVKRLMHLPEYSKARSTTDGDDVTCKHCNKQFLCDQCVHRRQEIGFLVEYNRRCERKIRFSRIMNIETESEDSSEDSNEDNSTESSSDNEFNYSKQHVKSGVGRKLETPKSLRMGIGEMYISEGTTPYKTEGRKLETYKSLRMGTEEIYRSQKTTPYKTAGLTRVSEMGKDQYQLISTMRKEIESLESFELRTEDILGPPKSVQFETKDKGKKIRDEYDKGKKIRDEYEKRRTSTSKHNIRKMLQFAYGINPSDDYIICQICVSDCKRAVYWCSECVQPMCRECYTNNHTQPVSSSHPTVLLGSDYSFSIGDIDIRGIGSLGEGQLILGDEKGKQLITCDINGHDIQYIPLPYEPYQLSVVDKNNVAVTTSLEKKVLIVDVRQKTVTREICMKEDCTGILYKNNHLYIGYGYHSLVEVDMSGEIFRTIQVSYTPRSLCGGTEGRIYCADHLTSAVYCIDKEGRTVLKVKKNDMESPYDIITDNEGHILVVCPWSNSIHRISPDGSRCRGIITDMQSRFPLWTSMYFDPRSKSLFIGYNSEVKVYKI